MYIEELIIDGFKSYAARTHITGWDSQFNAITGLNGSGKSNILDAICFVLGITNLSHVRANNLQDLVYKRGQAGISKASVTIVFNNNDTSKSPVGYEQYKQITVTRQILIGGRNKYIINGHNAQQQTLANLFQSVQLNIHNPHFLIMQGKITKVLNMKPPEILAMIEEAAGTRMFEERKEKAFKTIAKKEVKLIEIQSILDEEITPKLDKLKAEKSTYLQYQQVQMELEHKNKLLIAYKYTLNEQKLKASGKDFDAKKVKIAQIESNIDRTQEEISNIDSAIKKLQETKSKNDEISKLEDKVKSISKELTIGAANLALKSNNLSEEKQSLEKAKKSGKELSESIQEYRVNNTKLQESFKIREEEFKREEAEVEKAEELLQTLTTGISAKEGHENGYINQIQATKKEVAKWSTETERAHMNLAHLDKEKDSLKQKSKISAAENKDFIIRKQKAEKELNELEAKLKTIDYDPEQESVLRTSATELGQKIRDAKERKNHNAAGLGNLEFKYSDPHPNFDRSKVKGLVAELFSVDNLKYSTALEVCAGGRLYNVVVDDASTGADLLKRGKLRSRVTLIPLNKISAFKLSAESIATATRIAPNQVNLALSLIGYSDEIAEAMSYVFGSTLICDNQEVAREISSIKRIAKSVTIEGDVYDPSGTLQGGSKPNISGIIENSAKLQKINKTIKELEEKHRTLLHNLESMKENSIKYHEINKGIELKKHEINLIEKQLEQGSYAQIQSELEANQKSIEEAQNALEMGEKMHKEAINKIKSLEADMKEFKSNKSSKLEEMEARLKKSKKDLASKKGEYNKLQHKATTQQFELEFMEKELVKINETIQNIEANIKSLKDEELEIMQNNKTYQDQLSILEKELESKLDEQRKGDRDLQKLVTLKQAKSKQQNESKLNLQKLQHEIERFEKDVIDAERIVYALEKEHEWIKDQKSQFGRRDSNFDFSNNDMKEISERVQVLEKSHENLRKRINLKVMTLIDSIEKKEGELKTMLTKVKRDKSSIENTIHSLDDFKKEALVKTWEKVNADFGAIFSDLLPGNSAKLVIPENKTLMDGLEVKVNLGGVWKHSLTELSGGQRSLIALSLILSLLQFKPAPMYILDEIDAALDLSHTQNIGQLLRTRFKSSQFIIVSLKDGMFNNANVLFKAKFREGVSLVERIATRRS